MSHLRSLLKPGQMLHLPRVIVSAFVSAEAEAQQVETPVKTKSKVDHASVGLPCLLAALSLSFDTGPRSPATSLVAPVDSVNLFSLLAHPRNTMGAGGIPASKQLCSHLVSSSNY